MTQPTPSVAFYHESAPVKEGQLAGGALGGSESSVVQVARGLSRLGWDVSVLLAGLDRPLRCAESGATFRPLRDLGDGALLGWWDAVVAVRTWGCFQSRLPTAARLLWLHEPLTDPRWVLAAVPRVQRVVFVSEWQRRQFCNSLPLLDGMSAVVPNPIGFSELSTLPPRTEARAPVCVYLSRPERGLHFLLDLWRLVRIAVPDAELLVATYALDGETRHPALERARSTPGVRVLEPLGKASLRDLLLGVRLLVYPSDYPETFCLAVREAAACGVPAIVGPGGALPETVGRGGVVLDGPLLRGDLPAQFVTAVSLLLRNNDEWQGASARALEIATASSPAGVSRLWDQLLRSEIENSRSAWVGPPTLDLERVRRLTQPAVDQVRGPSADRAPLPLLHDSAALSRWATEGGQSDAVVLFSADARSPLPGFRDLHRLASAFGEDRLAYTAISGPTRDAGLGAAILQGGKGRADGMSLTPSREVPRPSVCAAILARNPGWEVGIAVRSVAALVDEILVLDTGSGPEARSRIAATLREADCPSRVVDLDWKGDYAHSRNEGFVHTDCDWLLWIDCDEELVGGDALLAVVQNPAIDAVCLPQVSAFIHGDRPDVQFPARLVRRTSSLRFRGEVHEVLVESDGSQPRLLARITDVALHHLGYLDEGLRRRKFFERDLPLLRREATGPNVTARAAVLWLRAVVNLAEADIKQAGTVSSATRAELLDAVLLVDRIIITLRRWDEYLLAPDSVSRALEILEHGVDFRADLAVGIPNVGLRTSQSLRHSTPRAARLPSVDAVQAFLTWLVDETVHLAANVSGPLLQTPREGS